MRASGYADKPGFRFLLVLIFAIAALIVPMQNASAQADLAAMNLIALSQLYAASAAVDASRKAYWGPFSVIGEGTAK